jgi:hypothetical protein
MEAASGIRPDKMVLRTIAFINQPRRHKFLFISDFEQQSIKSNF